MSGAPSGLALSSAGVLSWSNPVKGTYVLSVTVRDFRAAMGYGSIKVVVS